jgi:hypothetical protein
MRDRICIYGSHRVVGEEIDSMGRDTPEGFVCHGHYDAYLRDQEGGEDEDEDESEGEGEGEGEGDDDDDGDD